ncbi:AAA family ATPase [Candidatus Gracilibacteria bacterium]|nr:AAA family ATPase [Candidatus Gracilibacteria bacterium]
MVAPILAFVSVKGGVGKTTLALETASSLANHYGKKVLLVDANFSAPNIGLYLDLTNEITLHDALLGVGLHNAIYEAHGFDVVPAAMDYSEEVDVYRLKKVLEKMKYRYDYIILDSSPHHSEMKPVIAAADKIFVVTTPDHVTLATSLKAAMIAKKNNTPIEGVVVNRIRDPKHEEDLGDIEELMGLPVLARIRDHKKMIKAMYHKIPITLHDERNCISREICRFVSSIVGEPEKPFRFFELMLPFKMSFSKEIINRQLSKE